MADGNEGTVVRYPGCEVELLGVDQNAVAIFRKVRKGLISYLVDVEKMPQMEATAKGDEFQAEATSGDYDHVLTTCHRWVTVV